MDPQAKEELLAILGEWKNADEPLVEAIGDELARSHRMDSQEKARRVVETIIRVLTRDL